MPDLKCSKCGETASGPGAKEAMSRHTKTKHLIATAKKDKKDK